MTAIKSLSYYIGATGVPFKKPVTGNFPGGFLPSVLDIFPFA